MKLQEIQKKLWRIKSQNKASKSKLLDKLYSNIIPIQQIICIGQKKYATEVQT